MIFPAWIVPLLVLIIATMVTCTPYLLESKPGFLYHPVSGDLTSKQVQPLFGTNVYKVSTSTNNQKVLNRNDCTSVTNGRFLGHPNSLETLKNRRTDSYNV